MQPLVIKNFV